MNLVINGEPQTSPPATLSALVEHLGMKADRVAVELNREIVPRDQWPHTELHDGDRLEIVQFVGGGTIASCKQSKRVGMKRAISLASVITVLLALAGTSIAQEPHRFQPGFNLFTKQQDIQQAAERISGHVLASPAPLSIPLSEALHMQIYCKLEYLQRTGSARSPIRSCLSSGCAAG